MEKTKFKFTEVYFGNNCRKSMKITNHNSWAITSKIFPSSNSHSESQESFSFSDDRYWIRPSSILRILLSSCSTDGSLAGGSISANGFNCTKQVSPFFSGFVIPAALQLLEITCSPSGGVMWFYNSTSHFAWIGFKVARVSLTSICSTSLPSSSCCCTWWVYHSWEFRGFQSKNFAEINFAVVQKILEIGRKKFRGWQKILILAGIKYCDLAKKSRNREIFFRENFWQ